MAVENYQSGVGSLPLRLWHPSVWAVTAALLTWQLLLPEFRPISLASSQNCELVGVANTRLSIFLFQSSPAALSCCKPSSCPPFPHHPGISSLLLLRIVFSGCCFLLVLIYFLIWVKCILSSEPCSPLSIWHQVPVSWCHPLWLRKCLVPWLCAVIAFENLLSGAGITLTEQSSSQEMPGFSLVYILPSSDPSEKVGGCLGIRDGVICKLCKRDL